VSGSGARSYSRTNRNPTHRRTAKMHVLSLSTGPCLPRATRFVSVAAQVIPRIGDLFGRRQHPTPLTCIAGLETNGIRGGSIRTTFRGRVLEELWAAANPPKPPPNDYTRAACAHIVLPIPEETHRFGRVVGRDTDLISIGDCSSQVHAGPGGCPSSEYYDAKAHWHRTRLRLAP